MERDEHAPLPTMIRDLPESERPRERLRDAGPAALSNEELIAILLRTGNAKESAKRQAERLLADFGGVGGLARSSFAELCNQRGLGAAKAAQIKAAIELGVRASDALPERRRVFSSPEDVAELVLAKMSLLDQESVRVVLLDNRNHLIDFPEIYKGTLHSATVRISELLRDAVRTNANAMVCVHNHPSGDPTPSAADIAMTKQLCEAARTMDIELADHLVIAGGRYVSMRAARLGFSRDT